MDRPKPLATTRCLASLFGALLLCSCSLGKGRDTAKQATEQFHRQFAVAQDDAIYDAADPAYKKALSKETNRGLLSRIRRKMGSCQDSQNTNFFVNATTSGTFVTLDYTTNCANGNLEEKFVWRIEGERGVLLSYRASSPLLLTD